METLTTVPKVEREIGFDLVRRGLIVAPLIIAACAVLRGWNGVTSAGIAVAVVALNFGIAALIMTRVSDSGPTGIAIGACVGYLVRLGVVLAALILLHHQGWIDLPMFGIVLVATHLGLLFWEMKYLSITLGAPALHDPARRVPRARGRLAFAGRTSSAEPPTATQRNASIDPARGER